MPDLVDRIRSEVEARIRELRPVARELERLERAAAALARTGARSVPGLRSRVGTRASAPRAGRTAARTGKPAPSRARPEAVRTPRRRPAPRGQTREKVLEALAVAPGSSSAAVARAAGISPGVAAATISRLVKQGRVRRLEEGGYVVVETPTDDRPSASPSPTGAAEAAPAQASGVEGSGQRPPRAAVE
jgi:hypothetical protein